MSESLVRVDWLEMTTLGAPPADDTERGLVAASLGGERSAFEALVLRHQARVFRLASRFFRRREDVEDVAQETFLAAWSGLASYKHKAPFEHWLTRICLNSCYARLSQRSSAAERPLDAATEPAAPAAAPDAALDAERLLARLAPRDRFVLLLLDGEGWSVREIAARLGWTAVNVKVRAHRARRRLRAILEETP